jgi:hypothetical protein
LKPNQLLIGCDGVRFDETGQNIAPGQDLQIGVAAPPGDLNADFSDDALESVAALDAGDSFPMGKPASRDLIGCGDNLVW